jgi:hypothetical protein
MQILLRMSASRFVAPGLMIALFLAGVSKADTLTTGTLNFIVAVESSNTLALPTGSWVYDDTTNTLNSYTVEWNGAAFNYQPGFAGVGLSNLGNAGDWCAAGPSTGVFLAECGANGTFTLYTAHVLADSPATFTDPSGWAEGTFTVTEAATTPTPEPDTFWLLGLALPAGLWFRGRRVAKLKVPSVISLPDGASSW